MPSKLSLVGLLVLFSASCDPAKEQSCIPGVSVVCACPGGGAGAQQCADDGRRFTECDCRSFDAGAADPTATYEAAQRGRLAREADESLLFQVSLRSWLTPGALVALTSEAGAPRLERLHVLLPAVRGGWRVVVPLGSDALSEQSIRQALAAAADRAVSPQTAEAIRLQVEDGPILVGSLRARGRPAEVLRWWDAHPEQVRVVQTLRTDLDRLQRPIEPKEGVR